MKLILGDKMESSDDLNSKVDLYCFYLTLGTLALFIFIVILLIVNVFIKWLLTLFLGG